MEKRHVVVTTEHKGVFYGEFVSEKDDVVILGNAKMAVYWSANVKGVLGLASTGPLNGCRISPPVKELKLNKVTAVMDCTEIAIENWGKNIWD